MVIKEAMSDGHLTGRQSVVEHHREAPPVAPVKTPSAGVSPPAIPTIAAKQIPAIPLLARIDTAAPAGTMTANPQSQGQERPLPAATGRRARRGHPGTPHQAAHSARKTPTETARVSITPGIEKRVGTAAGTAHTAGMDRQLRRATVGIAAMHMLRLPQLRKWSSRHRLPERAQPQQAATSATWMTMTTSCPPEAATTRCRCCGHPTQKTARILLLAVRR